MIASVSAAPTGAAAALPSASWRRAVRGAAGQLARALSRLIAADEHAPTAIRGPELAGELHVADSLVALELAQVRDAGTIADLGSGAGFPGVALAVALPERRSALIESAAAQVRVPRAVCRVAAHRQREVVCDARRGVERGRRRQRPRGCPGARCAAASCSSTPRRCCGWAGRSSTGAAGARRPRRSRRQRAAALLGMSRS